MNVSAYDKEVICSYSLTLAFSYFNQFLTGREKIIIFRKNSSLVSGRYLVLADTLSLDARISAGAEKNQTKHPLEIYSETREGKKERASKKENKKEIQKARKKEEMPDTKE